MELTGHWLWQYTVFDWFSLEVELLDRSSIVGYYVPASNLKNLKNCFFPHENIYHYSQRGKNIYLFSKNFFYKIKAVFSNIYKVIGKSRLNGFISEMSWLSCVSDTSTLRKWRKRNTNLTCTNRFICTVYQLPGKVKFVWQSYFRWFWSGNFKGKQTKGRWQTIKRVCVIQEAEIGVNYSGVFQIYKPGTLL